MSRSLKHIKGIVELTLKGVLLFYFACFFLGKNVVTNLLSFEKSEYELYEEMESQDAEEENEVDDKEKEKEDKIKDYISLEEESSHYSIIRIETWNKSLNYEGFQREIPDPPPQV